MIRKRILSFKFALEGILTALKDEPNLKVHFLIGVLALILGFIFQISPVAWVILILVIGMVVALELTNTAIEELINSFTDKLHPSAKKAKDVAAGAVLVASMTALLIGAIIFLPYFQKLLAN